MTAKTWNVDVGDHQYGIFYSFDDEIAQAADAQISASDTIFILQHDNTVQFSERLKQARRVTFIYKNKVVFVNMQDTDLVVEELFDCILRYRSVE